MPEAVTITFASDAHNVGVVPVLHGHDDGKGLFHIPFDVVSQRTWSAYDAARQVSGPVLLAQDLPVITAPTGSGKTEAILRYLAELVASVRTDKPSIVSITPRQVVRFLARSLPSEEPAAHVVTAGSGGDPPFRSWFTESANREECAGPAWVPESLSSIERVLGCSRATAQLAYVPDGELTPLASPADRVRQILDALVRVWPAAGRSHRLLQTILVHLAVLLIARRCLRAPARESRAAPTGARGAAVRGGPRGPNNALRTKRSADIGRALIAA
ncbi:hypothetical protein GCM10009779_66350 [Polymorphospora rubra]|uniref:Uncharacterized protein n=1 Tax=Polymorphospora rubra TaxID=338584 RepID=A0A810MXV1_9ACTN|nr:hypothetical protein Prubr_18200 [Polymorphospora rubra]